MKPDYGKRGLQRHARLVGEVVQAWNELHVHFGLLFGAILKHKNMMIPNAIWTALTTDRAQRDVLMATISWEYLASGRKFQRIKWALDTTDKLSRYRNDAVHLAARPSASLHGQKPSTRTGYMGVSFNRAMRMSDVDFCHMLETLRGDVRQLSGYVDWLYRWVARTGNEGPLPRRPVMRSPRLFPSPSFPSKSRPRKKARKRQPPPSRG
jgi:hypothetical protein